MFACCTHPFSLVRTSNCGLPRHCSGAMQVEERRAALRDAQERLAAQLSAAAAPVEGRRRRLEERRDGLAVRAAGQ